MSYYPLKNGLYLFNVQTGKKSETTIVDPAPVHYIWIIDRSGSMTYLLSELVRDASKKVAELRDKDNLTLGWFSSEGQFAFTFSGNVGKEREQIKKELEKYSRSIGMTCFSEILHDTSLRVSKNLGSSTQYSVMFFTDGYPVVNNYQKEVDAIMKELKFLKNTVASFLWIGYGDYYNRELMNKMATESGGVLVHNSHLADFNDTLASYISGEGISPRIEVDLPDFGKDDIITVFGIETGGIVIYPITGKKVLIPDSATEYWVLARDNDPVIDIKKSEVGVVTASAAYASAYIMLASNQVDLALDILDTIGDRYYVIKAFNSNTNEEFGNIQNEIKNAVGDMSYRYKEGKQSGIVPDPNAFCLMDAFAVIMGDDKSRFLPYHPEFVYKRIGTEKKVKDGYPRFETSKDISVSMDDMVFHEKKANVSVRVRIPGTIKLDEHHTKYGLAEDFACYKWRTYNFVLNGNLNTRYVPMLMSEETFNELNSHDMIVKALEPEYQNEDGVVGYLVDFGKVPIVNRASTQMTGKDFCDLLAKESDTEARIKVVKSMLEKLDPSGEYKNKTSYTSEQMVYLESFGVRKDGSYNPPMEELPAIDQYVTVEFEIAIKGRSSLPKVDDVISKMKTQSLSGVQSVMANELDECNLNMLAFEDDAKVGYLSSRLSKLKDILKHTRNKIYRTKIGMVISKRWFPDVSTRDGAVVTTSDNTFTFKFKEVKEDI